MNGVMMPSVSAGSSHREARVTCTPQVMVPSGAALAGPKAPSVRAAARSEIRARHLGTLMFPPSWSQGWALPRKRLVGDDLALATAAQSRRVTQASPRPPISCDMGGLSSRPPRGASSYAPVVTSILAAGAVLAAALVKGAIGFGFPTLGTPLLSLAMDVKTAVAVLIVPNIAMDSIQFVRRGSPLAIVRRFAPLLAGGAVGTVVGTRLLM